jgi:hypothetical protein
VLLLIVVRGKSKTNTKNNRKVLRAKKAGAQDDTD